jgi:hypothetical protein
MGIDPPLLPKTRSLEGSTRGVSIRAKNALLDPLLAKQMRDTRLILTAYHAFEWKFTGLLQGIGDVQGLAAISWTGQPVQDAILDPGQHVLAAR